jgi:hypothetical protein
LTFKHLKKRVSLETTLKQQSKLFERLQNKQFWIWDVEEHKQEDIRTKRDCCFNHIIGLAQKDTADNDGTLDKEDKEATSYNDIFDAFRIALKCYHYEDSSSEYI